MKAVLQRVRSASVRVGDEVVGAIGPGLLVLLGVAADDTEAHADLLADKTAGLRIFAGDSGKFNCSVVDAGGAVLVVSQFTLFADTRHGRRPGFTAAAPPALAVPLIDRYQAALRAAGLAVQSGRFGAHMLVSLENDGPVTINLDSHTWL